MNCKIKVIEKNKIRILKPLWEKLNEIHCEESRYFKDYYNTFTFDKRCLKFMSMDENNIRIELVTDNNIPAGYCIATIEKTVGEIDSIFIEEKFRKHGIGNILIENGIRWLKKNNCAKILVAVAEGHESVFGFYRKFGFYPRLTYLQKKD